MADYTGSDRRLAYLFANGGGGGSCKVISGYYHNGDFYEDQSYTQIITGDTECLYIDLDTTTLYLFDGTDYVEVQGGGGGTVSDGTVGVRVDGTIPANSSVAYTFDDLGITERGYYLIGCASNRNESNGGWKWLGYMGYSGYYTSSYQTSYLKTLDQSYTGVTMSESAETITFANQLQWDMTYSIEVLPLHPKVEIPKHTYSTTEQVVGTWVDGKPIYEKTISFTNTQSSFSDYVTVESLTGVDKVIKMEWTAFRSANNAFYTGNGGAVTESATYNTYRIMFRYSKALEAVQYFIGGYGTEITDMAVTIQYTKV